MKKYSALLAASAFGRGVGAARYRAPREGSAKAGAWLLASHDPVTVDQVWDPLAEDTEDAKSAPSFLSSPFFRKRAKQHQNSPERDQMNLPTLIFFFTVRGIKRPRGAP